MLLAVALLVMLLNEWRTKRARLLEERQHALGLPPGDLVYENADGQGETLSSGDYPLIGKPDYVVQLADGRFVPVDLNLSVQNATAPYSNHAVQIAAYCLILESYSEPAAMPTHGIMRYADRDFIIDYTPALRKRVIRLLSEMDHCSEEFPPHLARQKVAKCRACVFQPICPVGQGK
jgi:CRISPR-associated exonuclease Cas4